MIAGIGIDSVEIERFSDWVNHSPEQLKKIFSEKEIGHCLQNKQNAPERFAARFAVREAFFKALSNIMPGNTIPFLTVCKNISIHHEQNGNPNLTVDWHLLVEKYGKPIASDLKTFISLTHTADTATALVIVENRQ